MKCHIVKLSIIDSRIYSMGRKEGFYLYLVISVLGFINIDVSTRGEAERLRCSPRMKCEQKATRGSCWKQQSCRVSPH